MDNQIKIRASMVGLIMTSPKLKADKKAGLLSETAKTFVESIWLENMFEYRKEVITDEIYKGLIVEQDAMVLVQSVLGGEFRKKYRHNLENDYLTGHPDIVLSDCVEDVKSSYDVRTFFNSELTPLY